MKVVELDKIKEHLESKDNILPEYMKDTMIHIAEKLAVDLCDLQAGDDDGC